MASPQEREYWLLAAYREAERLGDGRNLTWIAHSLAKHFVEAVRNDCEGARWLSVLEGCLGRFPDEQEGRDAKRLRGTLASRGR